MDLRFPCIACKPDVALREAGSLGRASQTSDLDGLNGRNAQALAGTPEQRAADLADAQEFHQIQQFVAACRRQWPGATIVLRPDGAPEPSAMACQTGSAHVDNAGDDPVQSESRTQQKEDQTTQTNHE